MSEQGVSVIVCLYNAKDKISETICALKNLCIEGIPNVELIFVNNNSSDNSVEIISQEMQGFEQFSYCIINESIPGLSNARMAGINKASYNYLLFCDDDNWLDEDYLRIGFKVLNSDHKIGILGGLGEAVSSVELPMWFNDVKNYYAVGPQAEKSGVVKGKRNVVYGAGMFVRKDYLLGIIGQGFTSFSSDRVGNKLSSGGDSELCLVFQIAGHKVWYDERLKFKHFIEANRLTVEYINALKVGIDSSRFITRFYLDFIQGYTPKITKYFWVKELCYAIKSLIVSFLKGARAGWERDLLFIKFLLTQKSEYNRNVHELVKLCQRLSA